MTNSPKTMQELLAWAQRFNVDYSNKFGAVRSADDLMQAVGTISCIAGRNIPKDYKECNGQLLKKKDYPELYKQLGDDFGHGSEPFDVFRLPDYASQGYAGSYVVIKAVGRRGLETPVGPVGVGGGGGGVSDHGFLTGLGDDDHPQYLNNSRGDLRYSLLGHGHAGLLPAGGAPGQVLAKVTSSDYATAWVNESFGIAEVTVNFTTLVEAAFFDVVFTGATVGQMVQATPSLKMPAGVDEDELELDPIVVSGYVTTAGQVRLLVASINQSPLYGSRIINVTLK